MSVVRRSRSGDVAAGQLGRERTRRRDPLLGHPADRPPPVVDEEEVGERVGLRAPARLGRIVAGRRHHRRLERQRVDALERQELQAAIRTDEAGDEVIGGLREDLRGGRELRKTAPDLHDRDEVAHLDGLVDVVGHEQDRLGELFLEAEELVLEPLADDRIDGAEGLVHEQDRWVRRERPGHPDALALAAGQDGRVAVRVARRVEAHELEQLLGTGASLRLVPAEQPGDRRNVLADRLVREQPDLLDHVADAPPELDHVGRHHVGVADEDPARCRLDEPVDHLERGRLAAAGRPDEDAHRPGRDIEREVLDGPGLARPGARVALRDVLEDDALRGGHDATVAAVGISAS